MAWDRRTFVECGAALGLSALAGCVTDGAAVAFNDPLYSEPYIDVDEWREAPERHRYIHGGFRGSELRFSMYFPPAEKYDGRFFQHLMAISGNENAAQSPQNSNIGFAFASGGYFIESNQGRPTLDQGDDPSITGFRASAATAEYSRVLARQMYGGGRPYGYVWGGSGGGFKTLACVENTRVWDGAVPYIHGTSRSLPNGFTVMSHALRLLQGKFDGIVDAVEPGGSGDMYAGLDAEQRAALEEITRFGFPPRAWFAYERLSIGRTGVFAALIGNMYRGDPRYFRDFWAVPGYLGANPPPSLLRSRVQHRTRIVSVINSGGARRLGLPLSLAAGSQPSAPAALQLATLPEGRIQGAGMTLRSGGAVGELLTVTGISGELVLLGYGGPQFAALAAMRAGDEIEIDNSDYLASQTYHRHQIPSPDHYAWDQYKDASGRPLYPQRPLLANYNDMGPGNSSQSGRFSCKMIAVISHMDESGYPWYGDWYHNKVRSVRGSRTDEQYRLWYVEHAMHGGPDMSDTLAGRRSRTRQINYTGVLQQALRDVTRWVEHGVPPAETTSYTIEDCQVRIPARAALRKSIQPVVALTANGGERAEVRMGEAVAFSATAETPPGAGLIVSAEWDFEDGGNFPERSEITPQPSVTVAKTHVFTRPGTYFPALRVTAQRDGDVSTPYGRIHNLGRVRVVVR